MAGNHVLLETISLTQTAASVTFDNIPQTGYTDLKIVMSTRAADSANNWYATKIQFNTDTTASNYPYRALYGFGSTVGSASSNQYAGYIPSGARTANTFGNNEIYIPNYTSSTAKSFSVDTVTEGNGTSYEILGLWAGSWSGTAAISQMVLSPDTGSWAANSTFSLYGVAATGTTPATAPLATGGNIVANDGTYWYHAFLTSGTFTPQTALTCDTLVIAGGGGGGTKYGGGGGAGGYLKHTSQSLAATSYTVTVGAGGNGAASSASPGSNGSNSQFAALTASVGGGGGGSDDDYPTNGSSGGSGGGGGTVGTGGSATSSQGYAGGNGQNNGTFYASAGGGGAGAVGVNGVAATKVGGNGGVGLSDAITGGSATGIGQLVSGSYYLAGGGGGGVYVSGGTPGQGGSGGGASANLSSSGNSGTANTGGGGGGTGNVGTGGNGGSGIVIIRYAMA